MSYNITRNCYVTKQRINRLPKISDFTTKSEPFLTPSGGYRPFEKVLFPKDEFCFHIMMTLHIMMNLQDSMIKIIETKLYLSINLMSNGHTVLLAIELR